MDAEDSQFLGLLAGYTNTRTSQGEDLDDAFDAAEMDIFGYLTRERPQIGVQFYGRTRKQLDRRTRSTRQVSRRTLAHAWRAFRACENLIAAAEVINQQQMDAIGASLGLPEKSRPSFLKQDGSVHGRTLKCLLLTSLHARSITTFGEIVALLKAGYAEGAAARCRTLHELTVFIWFLASAALSDGKNYELCERYYVSALAEWRLRGQKEDDVTKAIVRAARRKWGKNILRPYEWARLALSVPAGQRIHFADLERHVEAHDFRWWYLRFNEAIHSGALRAVERTDFRRRYPNPTGPQFEPRSMSRTGDIAAFLLDLATYAAFRSIAGEAREWDDMLLYPWFRDLVGEVRSAFGPDSSVCSTPDGRAIEKALRAFWQRVSRTK